MDEYGEAIHFSESMPANIALIKYIGKDEGNLPLHPTLSLSLPELYTTVHLSYVPSLSKDIWEVHSKSPKLSYKSIERYLQHLKRVKEACDFSGNFSVYAYNNFPMGTGLASSASSFAALTHCALNAIYSIEKVHENHKISQESMAQLSREGSGSSSRSFFSPWAISESSQIRGHSFGAFDELDHIVLVLSTEQKHISSSQAHQLVRTSPVFHERQEKVGQRFNEMCKALKEGQWADVYQLAWDDFIEMHRMFHTARPRFSYCTKRVTKILEHLQTWWQWHEDGPVITMDAGPNIHLLFRKDQKQMQTHLLKQLGNIDYIVGRRVQTEETKFPA